LDRQLWDTCPHNAADSAPERLAVMEMTDVLWSDGGNPERTLSGIEKIGKWPTLADDPLSFLYMR